MSGMYKGVVGQEGNKVGGGIGWAAGGRLYLPLGHRQWFCVFNK